MLEHSPSVLSLRTFGGLSIELNGLPLDDCIPLKAKALLMYICRQRQPQPREKLASLFWSDFAADRIAHNQRMALMPVRKHLAGHVEISRNEIEVHAWVDVNAFEHALDELYPVLNGDQPFTTVDIENLAEALALYRSDFLADVHFADASAFDEWVTVEREALRQRYIHAASRLIDGFMETTRYVDGINLSLRLLSTDPLHEDTHRRLMMLYAIGGDRSSALQQFERYQSALWDELGVEPDDETIKLYEHIAAGEFESMTAHDAVAQSLALHRVRNNLPGEMSLFVGRTNDIEHVAEGIRNNRCVTLIGPGGIGKTRLALQAAHRVMDRFSDGVFWVDLAPLLSPNSVADAIRRALDLPDNGAGTVHDLLAAFLRDKQLLLVLDNFEHVLDAADQLYELLRSAPTLHVLTTSRESLRLYGEYVYDVPAMPTQDASTLFLNRARTVQPNLQPDNPELIERLCARLDYLPLALELAASQARTQTIERIYSRLDTARLATNLRGVPERHRTLFNTIEWSYELLTSDEQILYRRLAYLVGAWTAEAAFAICGSVAEHLDILVERSLLRCEIKGEEARYSMLETIREHARLKLTTHNEETPIREQYLKYFIELAERGNIGLRGRDYTHWFNLLDANIPNFHAAIEVAQFSEHAMENECRLISALGVFWHNATYQREAHVFAQHALAYQDDLPPDLAAGILAAYAHTLRTRGDYQAAMEYHEQARLLYQACGDRWGEGLMMLCQAAHNPDVQGNLARLEQALELTQDLNDVFLFGWLSGSISMIYSALGDPAHAEGLAREGLKRADGSLGDASRELYLALGASLREQNHMEGALKIYRDYCALANDARDRYLADLLFEESLTCLLLNRATEAETCFQRGLDIAQAHESLEHICKLNMIGGIVAYAVKNVRESQRRYRMALDLFIEGGLLGACDLEGFSTGLAALVYEMAAEGHVIEAAHLRVLLLQVLADFALPINSVKGFYLNRAAPLLNNIARAEIKDVNPRDLFIYAQGCIAVL